jgi:cell wall-associated NlpC family hydrolase
MVNISATALIARFTKMLGWKYIWGAAREGVVDCSGAFTYAYSLLKSWMYHGSNTMWSKYSYAKGKIGDVELLPGQPVYKYNVRANGTWDVHHVGEYIGRGWVIEAKGFLYGVILSRIEEWHITSKLKSKDGGVVIYDAKEEPYVIVKATVVTTKGKPSNYVNLRSGATSVSSKNIIGKVYHGAEVEVLTDVPVNPGWYAVRYKGTYGCMDADFLKLSTAVPTLETRVSDLERRVTDLEKK